MNPTDDLNQLGYASSAPDLIDFGEKDTATPEDENDLTTLKRLFVVLRARDDYYNSNEAITYGHDLTIENQHIIAHQMRLHIQELTSLIRTTILKIEEKQNNGR